ncbi:hypothetical protein HTSR_0695 [Halodesulfurarchaeum formicicum]|uniref:Uncharacterized protein n=1 Tax=Halodesulfurarchaeum formicicum TaxID=1873524 RepID=A0A1D8S3E9_9EURY|nr:hypothetical protein [Halodesulfurarchaeum formicicum]AOW79887.1 hypothetical protein HTSR_0695 [Halodesulfurarchaeum formicicum]APE95180.1 hypothetical protein HSR6_0721 [Halodesulfurarchaeum formicicum]
MGIVEFHVDQIEVETVPKLVLFDRSDGVEKPAGEPGSKPPVSPLTALGVAVFATVLAVAIWKLASRVKNIDRPR